MEILDELAAYDRERQLTQTAIAKLAFARQLSVSIGGSQLAPLDLDMSNLPSADSLSQPLLAEADYAGATEDPSHNSVLPLKQETNLEEERLIRDNMGLVEMVINWLRISPYDYANALSDGVEGLWQAAQRFKPERGVEFSTFAVHRIKGAVIDGQRTYYKLARKRGNERQELTLRGDTLSLDHTYKDMSEPFSNMLPDSDPTPEDLVMQAAEAVEREQTLQRLLGFLTPTERYIITEHSAGKTLAEIGKDCGFTESRACQMHANALARLRIEAGVLNAQSLQMSPYFLLGHIQRRKQTVQRLQSSLAQSFKFTSQQINSSLNALHEAKLIKIDERGIIHPTAKVRMLSAQFPLDQLIELDHMSLGFSSLESATLQAATESGVKYQRKQIMRKLGASNAPHAVRLGIERGLLLTGRRPDVVVSLGTQTLRVIEDASQGMDREATSKLQGKSEYTVKSQRNTAAKHLGAKNIAHAVRLAYENGLLGA